MALINCYDTTAILTVFNCISGKDEFQSSYANIRLKSILVKHTLGMNILTAVT